jgi:hypothetical protein
LQRLNFIFNNKGVDRPTPRAAATRLAKTRQNSLGFKIRGRGDIKTIEKGSGEGMSKAPPMNI